MAKMTLEKFNPTCNKKGTPYIQQKKTDLRETNSSHLKRYGILKDAGSLPSINFQVLSSKYQFSGTNGWFPGFRVKPT